MEKMQWAATAALFLWFVISVSLPIWITKFNLRILLQEIPTLSEGGKRYFVNTMGRYGRRDKDDQTIVGNVSERSLFFRRQNYCFLQIVTAEVLVFLVVFLWLIPRLASTVL